MIPIFGFAGTASQEPGPSGACSAAEEEVPYPETIILLAPLWVMEDRPPEMRDPKMVGKLTVKTALEYKAQFEALEAKQGKGDTVFGKDNKIPSKKFGEGEDNCCDVLHPARWERMPVEELKKYWKAVPLKRVHTYSRLPLEHHGAAGMVSECVIVRAHDRSLPLKINMFFKGNSTKKSIGSSEAKETTDGWESPFAVLDIMEAILNFGAVHFCLWHIDPTPQILLRLLVHYNFAAGEDRNERDRCKLIIEVIDDILRTNSSRSIGGDPPLTFRECRERWKDAAEKRPADHSNKAMGGGKREADSGSSGRDNRFKNQDGSGSRFNAGQRAGANAKSLVLLFQALIAHLVLGLA